MSDTLNLISSGQQESVGYLKGIDDMVWTVSRPGVCEYCDSRDGLTSTEIKEQIKDDYEDDPPPLHPNCNCEYQPQLSDAFKDQDLSEQGVEWDPESGDLTIPEDVRDKYRLDLNFDEFVDYLSKGG
jgi:hypothetical protein